MSKTLPVVLLLVNGSLLAQKKLTRFEHYFTEEKGQEGFRLYDLIEKGYYTTDSAGFEKATSPASLLKFKIHSSPQRPGLCGMKLK